MLTKSTLRGGILLLSVIAVPAGLAETLCVDPADGDCHATIQSAVDAASPGDVILIAPHPDAIGYRENIVIDKADLTLRGDTIAPTANILEQSCPQVVLDGCEAPAFTGDPCGSIVIDVTAANASIERILLRHGQIRFGVGAEGSVLREACIVGNVARALVTAFETDEWGNIELTDPVDSLTVEDSVFQGGRSYSIRFLSNNSAIRNNQFYAIDNGVLISLKF
jgi:pectin methylesterase-like acyl-CoA thioesterase